MYHDIPAVFDNRELLLRDGNDEVVLVKEQHCKAGGELGRHKEIIRRKQPREGRTGRKDISTQKII